MLILGENTDTALSILRYSDLLFHKSKSQRKHLRLQHFAPDHFRGGMDTIRFLPVQPPAAQMLTLLLNPHTAKLLFQVPRFLEHGERSVINLLDCRLNYYRSSQHTVLMKQNDVEFYLYSWQQPLVERYFTKLLKERACYLRFFQPEELDTFLQNKTCP